MMARAQGHLQLARHTRPWTLGAGAWSQALKQIARTEEVLIDADEHTYTIYDGYPKAQFHFLVLPRLPFYCDEVLENGKRKRIQIPTRELDSISSVLASRHASFILECLQRASDRA
ncbi:HNT3 [Malassezia furfur]|nr:HNT3 [Malassezia furfur]